MSEIKFTDQEVKQVSEVRESYQNLTIEFGRIQLEIENLKLEKQRIINSLKVVKDKEKEVVDALTEKYGAGSLDPVSGVFTPQ